MEKKAKLDILGITIDENVEKKLVDDTISEKEKDEGSEETQTGGLFFSKVRGWVHRPLFWIILVSGVLLGSTAGIFFILYRGKDVKPTIAQEKQAVSGSHVQAAEKIAFFEGFVIDQKDEKGSIRIVFCDIALELEKPKTVSALGPDLVDVRNVILAVLKKAAVKEGLSPEGRNRLKAELRNELNSLFGENLVESVYFTRYEIN